MDDFYNQMAETIKVISLDSLCERFGCDSFVLKGRIKSVSFGDASDTLVTAGDVLAWLEDLAGNTSEGLDFGEDLMEALKNMPEEYFIGLGS